MAQGRRVRRAVRRIDTWSVFRIAILFYLSMAIIVVLAGVLLWLAGSTVGVIDDFEKFMRGVGFEDFQLAGATLLRAVTAAGLVLVLLGTGLTVLASVMYNLISDLVGGIQLTVLEEEASVPRAPDAANGPAPARATTAKPRQASATG